VDVQQTNTPKGSKFTVSCLISFSNPYPLSIAPLQVAFNFWIYYKGVPIVNIYTKPVGKIELVSGAGNHLQVFAVTKPENMAQTLEFIGLVADGQDVDVSVRDIMVQSLNSIKWQWVVDLLDGVAVPVTVPGIKDEFKFTS
jgi:hypothetical protein